MTQIRRASLPPPIATCASLLLAWLAATTRTPAAICDGISPASATPLTTVRITTNVTRPNFVTAPPGDTHRIFILEQDGRVRIVEDGVLLAPSFLDVAAITRSPIDAGGDDEQGLLGLAFSPNYANDGLFFIYHTDAAGTSNLVARYHVSANPNLADASTRTVVITLPHPTFTNHNGGDIMFGPDDGYLYIGTGDGGNGCDAGPGIGNAQNTSELRGKMLRIDVIPPPIPTDPQYRIPPDNPGYPAPEVFSIGLRNPWRYSFDRQTHDLYIADVGQNQWEEIDYRTAANRGNGANYGWQNYEGLVCPAPMCDAVCTPLATRVDPVKVYPHTGGHCAVSGGYVYRGCRMPSLAAEGRYFYADYCIATIDSFVISGGVVTNEVSHTGQLSPSVGGFSINTITSWGEDARGELYIVDRGGTAGAEGAGEIFKIVPVLQNLEVSADIFVAPGTAPARPFLLTPTLWSWEDLALTSSHPLDHYRVYRHDGAFATGGSSFTCVHKTPAVVPPARPAPIWPGGDTAIPSPAGPGLPALFSYVVTAVRNTPFAETSAGCGYPICTARTLEATACP